MKFRTLIATLTFFLTFSLPLLAQDATQTEYIVKVIYFLGKDRVVDQDANNRIDRTIKRAQKFYADHMEKFGFGRKTFKYESDANGNVLVHHVIGEKDSEAYRKRVGICLNEASVKRIQTQNTTLIVFVDHGIPTVGQACGLATTNSRSIVPAKGFCHRWQVVAHELGHNWGLLHDYRPDGGIMGGPGDGLAQCAAEFLNYNPYFNDGKGREIEQVVKINMLPSITYPQDNRHIFFELTDLDGLFHIQFIYSAGPGSELKVHGCKSLYGEKGIAQIDSAAVGNRVYIKTVDLNGNARFTGWKNFNDVESRIKLDISQEASNVNDGLIGYWSFDEASGSYTFDGSSNNRYARLREGAVLDFNSGKIGGAIRLDGVKKDATVKHSAELINGLSAFSLCLWVKSNHTRTDRGFINGRTPNGKDEFFGFRYDKDGYKGGESSVIKAGFTTTGGTHGIESSGGLQSLDWQHLAFTWRSGESMKLYIDGVLDTPSWIQSPISGTITDVDRLIIGRSSKDVNGGWDGLIDDVRLYNKVLSAEEIGRLPHVNTRVSRSYGVALTSTANFSAETLKASADLTWTLTATNTSNIYDTIKLTKTGDSSAKLSKTSVPLAPGTSATVTLTLPKEKLHVAGEYVFDITATSQGDHSTTAKTKITAIVNPIYDFTLEDIKGLTNEVQHASSKIEHTLKLTNTGTKNDTIHLTQSAGASGTLSETSVSLAPGEFSIVTLTVHGSAVTLPGRHVVMVTATSEGDKEKTEQFEAFTYVYPNSIEAVEIQEGLIGYWPFDEGGGDDVADASGNGNDLTKRDGGRTWTFKSSARIGDSAFHAREGRAYFATESVDFINGLDQFSLSLWVKSQWENTDRGFVLGKSGSNPNDSSFSFRYDGTGSFGGASNCIKAGITTTTGTHQIETSANSTSTDWQHLVFTWTSGETMKVYIDGVLDTLSYTGAAVSGTITDVDLFSIGRASKTKSDRGWRGHIDDVRLYNRTLNHTEIVALASPQTNYAFLTPSPSYYEVKLVGVGDLTNQTQDASAGVTYYFTVTNNGNTTDTIRLATAGDVAGTLSQKSVTLAAGESAQMTMTIQRSALTVPGEYVVEIRATSTNDNMKTAAVTTTTTIYAKTVLLQNFPNPCNPETWIPYQLGKTSDVKLIIYSMTGEIVRTLALGHQLPGLYQGKSRGAYWDGTNGVGEHVATGIYFYKLETEDFNATRKMLILK